MKKDLQRLQSIQNQAMKLLLKKPRKKIPTLTLLKETNSLSVHQLGAELILNQAKKILITGKPEYLKDNLQMEEDRRGNKKVKRRRNKLNMTDEGFVEKAAQLLNMIPPKMLAEEKLSRFKNMFK